MGTKHLNTPECREKRRKTMLERYGSAGYPKTAIQKSIVTCRRRHEERYLSKAFNELSFQQKRRRLIETRGYRCEVCKNTEWLFKPITLEIDHISGNRKDNTESNLRLICPNCHSQTVTWKVPKKTRYTVSEEAFVEALKSTPTIRQCLIMLDLDPKGANYHRAYKLRNKYGIVQTKNANE